MLIINGVILKLTSRGEEHLTDEDLFGLIGATKPGQPSWNLTSCLIKWEANSYGFG